MVLLEWKKLKSNVSVKETKKQLFGKYYYSVKYLCPGGRTILDRPEVDDFNLAEAIEARRAVHRYFNYGGSWRAAREQLQNVDLTQLAEFRKIKKQYSDKIKIRVEEPYITLYAADEDFLLNLANSQLMPWADNITQVSRSSSEENRTLIESGAILIKTDIGYKYKFICKDGYCNNKDSIYTYLDQLGDQVKVTRSVWMALERPGSYIWGVWFYGNDPNLGSMLNIIEPNFVTNIHQLVLT